MLNRNTLQQFYADKGTMAEVRAYLLDYLKDEAVRMIFDHEETAGIAQAAEMIDKAWDHLGDIFESLPIANTTNESK